MKFPLISIIMPTFNNGKDIQNAIVSVLGQTYQNWELIIVDNYSIDDTSKILTRFKDTRIKVYKNKNNGIIANGRNFGISRACGDWIAFLDSDDSWVKSKLEDCIQFSEFSDLIYHKLQKFSVSKLGKLSTFGNARVRNVEINPEKTLRKIGPCMTTSAIIVRSSVLASVGFFDEDPDISGGEDYDLWLRIACYKYRFKYIPKVLGGYQIGGNNFSSSTRSLRIIRYLDKKHFIASDTPAWILSSELICYLKQRKLKTFFRRYIEIFCEVKVFYFLCVNYIIIKKFLNLKVSLRTNKYKLD
jgi:glycosyltransferase involved in cell wall biosynthesis